MKALLSTALLLSAVTLGALTLAAVTLVAALLAASTGFAADAAIPRDFPPVGFQGGYIPNRLDVPWSYAPNRLDVYDLRGEIAREAEHDRIRTRLGDPIRWCRPVGLRDDFGTPYPGGRPEVLIVCR
jgi:hypothetical protein